MANYSATITGHGFAESKNTHTPSIKFALKATYDLDAQQPTRPSRTRAARSARSGSIPTTWRTSTTRS